MKRMTAILLTLLFAVSALSACSININIGNQPTEEQKQDVASSASDSTQAAATSAPGVGTLGDYVKTEKEVTKTYENGNTVTMRMPKILLDSPAATEANAYIEQHFGSELSRGDDTSGMYALDYEAYLNDEILSVVIISKYDGGNTFGVAYNFDVLTGELVDNQRICDEAGQKLDDVFISLRAAVTVYYEEKFASLPMNDELREKTFSDKNIKSSVLYFEDNHKIMALTTIYAAVGGGQWVVQFEV